MSVESLKLKREGCDSASAVRHAFRVVRTSPTVVLVVVALASAPFERQATAQDWSFFKQATRNLSGESTGSVTADGQATTRVVEPAPWLPPATNVHPRRRRPRGDWSTMTVQLYCCSYPASPPLQSVLNPWGEQASLVKEKQDELTSRILAACEVYRYQNVHFDGYLDSEDDGQHLFTAADGRPIAWFGDNVAKTYRRVLQSLPDTLDERCWICVDLPIFVLNLSGFPIRQAMLADFLDAPDVYMNNGCFADNIPVDVFFFRRVDNLRLYFRRHQFYSHDCITVEQYLDPAFLPGVAFRPGDVIFMGHWHPTDARGPFDAAKHSGIVESVDERGMPLRLYNMRTSNRLIDRYDTVIGQMRTVKGKRVYMHRFYDRYSIIGHGRIVQPFRPKGAMPTLDMARAWRDRWKAQMAEATTSPTTPVAVSPASVTVKGGTTVKTSLPLP